MLLYIAECDHEGCENTSAVPMERDMAALQMAEDDGWFVAPAEVPEPFRGERRRPWVIYCPIHSPAGSDRLEATVVALHVRLTSALATVEELSKARHHAIDELLASGFDRARLPDILNLSRSRVSQILGEEL